MQKLGSCEGNDSRCPGSGFATCSRLSAQGSDCRWEDPSWTSGPAGKCVGNDSRCAGRSERACTWLSDEGADCKWRAAFKVTGNISLIVTTSSNTSAAEQFSSRPNASSAIGAGLANVAGVSAEYLDVDLIASAGSRRLAVNALPDNAELIATYGIYVPGDAPASLTATGNQVGDRMQPTRIDAIEQAIASSVASSMGGRRLRGETYHISVQSVSVPNVVVAESASLSGSQALRVQSILHLALLCVMVALASSSTE